MRGAAKCFFCKVTHLLPIPLRSGNGHRELHTPIRGRIRPCEVYIRRLHCKRYKVFVWFLVDVGKLSMTEDRHIAKSQAWGRADWEVGKKEKKLNRKSRFKKKSCFFWDFWICIIQLNFCIYEGRCVVQFQNSHTSNNQHIINKEIRNIYMISCCIFSDKNLKNFTLYGSFSG